MRAYQRYPTTQAGRAWKPAPTRRGKVGAWNRRSRSTDGGAPRTVRPTTCEESFRVANTLSVIRRKGRRGRRPLRWLRVVTFQRSREVQFITPVALYAASPVSLSPVGCTVLGAPWSRDRRAALDAPARRDQPRSRRPRCARLASTTPRMQSRGHSPRTICATWGNRIRRVVCRSVCIAPTVGGGVPDAPSV